MKSLKRLGIYFLVSLSLLTLWLLFPHPSDAINHRNQRMIELGLIDEVKSAEELGLEHLLHHPPQLNARLIDNLREGQRQAAQDTTNITRAIELGTNRPVAVGDFANDNGDGRLTGDLDAIGVVTPSGEIEPIITRDLVPMFENEEAGGGTLTTFEGSVHTLIADARGTWLQAERVPVFDLIVYKRNTGKTYLVPSVLGDAFCRDALNNVLRTRGRLRRNTVNLQRIKL